MGTWSHGNFDEDTAANHLSELTQRLVDEVAAAMSNPKDLEPDEYWGCAVPCNIEILNLIARQRWVGTVIPLPFVAKHWKTTFMAAWEGQIDNLKPVAGHKEARRKVLLDTFDELYSHSVRRHGDIDDAEA